MSEVMEIEGVVMRGVRAKPDALPTWQFLATPVEILAGGQLSVAPCDWVWGGRAGAHVFTFEQADRVCRLASNEVSHVYPATVSREEAHPSAHVERERRPAERTRFVTSAVSDYAELQDWHVGKPNCGVD